MKETISIEFDEDKLCALELELKKERGTVRQFLSRTLDELYEAKVPEPVRAFITGRAARPKRLTKIEEARHEQ